MSDPTDQSCAAIECCPDDPFAYRIPYPTPEFEFIADEGEGAPIIGEGGEIIIPE